jgi:opacity protein-like surface antigen
MEIKKYAFLSLALLTSMSKALFSEDSCFKFYVGGDLGMGIFSIDHIQGEYTNPDESFFMEPIYYTNSKPVFIGGGRVGLAWTGLECWYAAIEGNVHSASRSGCTQGEFDADSNGDKKAPNPQITFVDKTKFIAGVHAHLGYKAAEDAAIYGIVGYKYLRTDYSTTYAPKTGIFFETINDCGCFNNNGWVAGLGAIINLECNWDVRLEALYSSFGIKCGTDSVDFLPVEISAASDYTFHPRLFYGVVSICYNF